MSHYAEIHRVVYDELCDVAAGWCPEAVQEALAAGRKYDRAMRAPSPDFRFDRSRHGTEARVAQVMQRLGAAEPMPNGLCE